MAQQTINVGTAPNDGTGTPLRTAFQYTNSNFSELYTAVGPSGNNIVVPGNATITGALTAGGNVGFGTTNLTSIIGYNTLKINNATNGAILDLAQGDAYKGRVIGSLNGLILESAVGLPVQIQVGGLNSFKADPAGVYTWYDGAGGVNQRMQLNSTGLGVATTAYSGTKLTVLGVSYFSGGASSTEQIRLGYTDGTSYWGIGRDNVTTGNLLIGNGSTRLTIDTSGNVGIGMAPLTSSKLSLFGGTGDTSAADTIFSLSRTSSTGNVLTGKVVLAQKTTDYGNIVFRIKTTASSAENPAYYTDALTIDGEKGNVGIGVTPANWATIKALQVGAGASLFGYTATEAALSGNTYYNAGFKYVANGQATQYQQQIGEHRWYTAPSGTAGNAITFTQAMTLDSGGKLVLGTTAAYNAARLTVQSAGGVGGINTSIQNDNDSYYAINFRNSSGVSCGSISCLTSSTAFNTSSDYRLKEAVQPIIGALSRVSALKPSIYKWKVDGSSGEGFLAHELAEVVPFAVTGEKDAVNEDGSIKPQGVDLSKIVPVLVAAIQELAAEVNALKNA